MAVEGMAAIGAGLAIGISALATAWAQAKIGSAGVGALAEDDSLFGNVLILTALPETIVIFGLVVALVVTGFIGGA
jgi:V/A-type H+-transporting ATPase subunit K